MASKLNLPGMQDLLDGSKTWAVASDIRSRLLMTNTTAGTENNKATNSAYTTIDSFDGSGASNVALTSEAVNIDSVNNRIEADAGDLVFGALGNGTRQIQGVLLYFHVTNDTDSIPLCFIEFSSTINPGGASVTVVWSAEGIAQFA